MIWVFIAGFNSSVLSHHVLGFEINQWQYWAVSLPIISMGTIINLVGRKC